MKTLQLFSNADASTTQVSVEAELGDLTEYAIQEVFSSNTLNGTLTLEASNDNVNWSTIPGSSVTVVSGATNVHSVTSAGYRFSRVRWVPTSGTGTITAIAIIKEPANRF